MIYKIQEKYRTICQYKLYLYRYFTRKVDILYKQYDIYKVKSSYTLVQNVKKSNYIWS